MIEKDICGVYYINKEIQALHTELANLRNKSMAKRAATNRLNKSINTDFISDHAAQTLKIEKLIECKLYELQCKREKAERFIEQIEDPETRLIVRLRAINNMEWDKIGMEVGVDRRTASRKYYGYFESCPQCDTEM